MTGRFSRQAVALVALVCMGTAVHEAHSALLISGPAAGAPGDDLTFSVTLDAPLTGIDIDDLTLTLDFDSNVLSGHDATQGALVAVISYVIAILSLKPHVGEWKAQPHKWPRLLAAMEILGGDEEIFVFSQVEPREGAVQSCH